MARDAQAHAKAEAEALRRIAIAFGAMADALLHVAKLHCDALDDVNTPQNTPQMASEPKEPGADIPRFGRPAATVPRPEK